MMKSKIVVLRRVILLSLHGAKVLTPNLFMPKMDTPNTLPPTSPNLIKPNLATLLTKLACTQRVNSREVVREVCDVIRWNEMIIFIR
jgi:hypothetical protein